MSLYWNKWVINGEKRKRFIFYHGMLTNEFEMMIELENHTGNQNNNNNNSVKKHKRICNSK